MKSNLPANTPLRACFRLNTGESIGFYMQNVNRLPNWRGTALGELATDLSNVAAGDLFVLYDDTEGNSIHREDGRTICLAQEDPEVGADGVVGVECIPVLRIDGPKVYAMRPLTETDLNSSLGEWSRSTEIQNILKWGAEHGNFTP